MIDGSSFVGGIGQSGFSALPASSSQFATSPKSDMGSSSTPDSASSIATYVASCHKGMTIAVRAVWACNLCIVRCKSTNLLCNARSRKNSVTEASGRVFDQPIDRFRLVIEIQAE